MITPVILSGGAGSRLWPLSRLNRPKPFHALTGESSLLADTLDRLCDGDWAANFSAPVIVCAERHAASAREALAGRAATLILEPEPKSTAAAAAAACRHALAADPEAIVIVTPADHYIGRVDRFRAALATAAEAARAGRIVMLGVRPTAPQTGYGYIRRGGALEPGVFEAAGFVEKPDADTAAAYLTDGGYFWNAGVFVMRADVFLEELARLRPDISAPATRAYAAARRDDGQAHLDAAEWSKAAADSIDYAVVEKTARSALVPVEMEWSDIGSWDAVHAAAPQDANANALRGDAIVHDSSGCLVWSQGGRLVALAGCSNLVVIDTGDAVCVAPRDRAQEVRDIVDRLKRERPDKL